MVKISTINTVLFLVIFCTFVFAFRIQQLFNAKITGLEYLLWLGFVLLLSTVNFRFLSRKIMIPKTYFFLLSLLLLFCFLNYFFSDADWVPYLQGTFFSFLFAANFILFYNIRTELKDIYFIINVLIAILSLFALAIYAERIFVERHYVDFFLRGVQTLAKDTGFAATLLNINIILCLGMFIVTARKRYLLTAIGCFITIVLLLYLKSVLSSLVICISFFLIYFDARVRKALLISFGILLALFLLLLGKPFANEVKHKYDLYFGHNADSAPRIALYTAGLRIAADYFPFGSGQGTFGSYPVGKNYSSIYYKYRLNKVYGLGPDAGKSDKENFLFDTYWSHILGEMGFIAAGLFLWLWFYPALKTSQFLFHANSEMKALSFITAFVIITIFIESLALSIPEQLQFIMLYAGLGAMAYRHLREMSVKQQF